MATNKHATIRYQALDKCFRNTGRRFFIQDLIEACNEAICNFDFNSDGIKRRQIFDDIRFMESESGWSVPLARHKDGKKVYYRYEDSDFSINKQPLNENEKSQLKEALLTLSRFKGMPQFEWIDEMISRLESEFELQADASKLIEFSENKYLKGINFFSEIYYALINRKALSVNYQSYRNPLPQYYIFHPWYLKQFNNRWFAFGMTDSGSMYTLALDRIVKTEPSDAEFIENHNIDFREYFEDVIGVTIRENSPVLNIRILILHDLWPYIESKPLHGSQKKKETTDKGVIIEISVIPNYELDSILFSYSDGVEVISPPEYREYFAEKVKRLNAIY